MPLLANRSNLLNANGMAKGMHRDTSLDSATCVLVVASRLVLLISKIVTLIKLSNASILAHLSILMQPFLQGIG